VVTKEVRKDEKQNKYISLGGQSMYTKRNKNSRAESGKN